MLHRLRSALTMTGVVFGVGSVIVMLAVGEGAREQAVHRIEQLGATNIIVRSVKPTDASVRTMGGSAIRYGLSPADLELLHSLPTVDAIAPSREHRKVVRSESRKVVARVVAVTPKFFDLNKLQMRAGRFLHQIDNSDFRHVAVLAAEIADRLFPLSNPLGQAIRVGEYQYFQIVGVVQARSGRPAVGNGIPAQEFSEDVYIPFESDRMSFGRAVTWDRTSMTQGEMVEISEATVSVTEMPFVKKTASIVNGILQERHPDQDTIMTVPLRLLEEAEATHRMLTLVLGAIASISLLVGGIGIMNIMLATVTERTREIGIRRALGARKRDIVWQFLVETIVLSATGGLLGIGLGVGLARLIGDFQIMPTTVHAWAVILAVTISVAIGIVFGLYPALRAARLTPVEAIRRE